MKFSEIANKLKGLDIETTGSDPAKGGIYSIGVTGRKEIFIKAGTPEDIAKNNLFQNKQLITGSFEAYREAINTNQAFHEVGGMGEFLKAFEGKDIFLVQNLNFENKNLSALINRLDREGQTSDLGNKFRDVMEYTQQDKASRYFYQPPEVTTAREGMYDLLDRSKPLTQEHIDKYLKHSTSVMDAYKSALGQGKRQGAVFLEMMDFTNHLYAAAASKGLMSEGSFRLGYSNMDLLSQVFKGKREAHTAGKDADLAIDMFRKITGITEEIESGNVSGGSKVLLRKLDKAIKISTEERMFASAIRGLEEAESEDGYKLISPASKGERAERVTIRSKAGKTIDITRQDFEKVPQSMITSDPDIVIQNVIERFKNKGGDAIHASNLLTIANNSLTIKGKKEALFKRQQELQNEIFNKIKGFGDEAEAPIFDKIKTKAQNIGRYVKANKGKSALIAAGIVGAAWLFSGSDEPEKPKQRVVPEDVFRQYRMKKPVVYHGSGFYDFENRTGHHKA